MILINSNMGRDGNGSKYMREGLVPVNLYRCSQLGYLNFFREEKELSVL